MLPSILAVLAYGRSGTGKTTFASSFPKPLLLLDIKEKGTDSISNVKDVQVAKIEDWHQIEDVYWYLDRGKHGFKTVVLDQMTALQDLAMRKVMKDEGKEEGDHTSKRIFGMVSGLMKTWIEHYRDLIDRDVHVVFLAHDRVTTSDDDTAGDERIDPSVGARMMPSAASFLNGAVKIIGNTFIRENYTIENRRKVRSVEYCMRIGPHAYYTTKTRSPVGVTAPEVIVDPTYDKLVAVMEGTYSDQPTRTVRRK